MGILSCLEKLSDLDSSAIRVEEFNKSKHMRYAKNIMDFDEELTQANARYNPAIFDDEESYGKISYEKYITLLLDNNWRLFVITYDEICIGYIHTTPGKYKNSVYIGSLIITKAYTGKGYGKIALNQFEKLIRNEYSIMILNVAVNNKPAVRLYEHSGFHATHMMMSKKLK